MAESNVEHVTVFKAKDGWRWRAQAGNNEIVAQGEAYTRKEDAERAAGGVFPGVTVEWEPSADEPIGAERAVPDEGTVDEERAEPHEGTAMQE